MDLDRQLADPRYDLPVPDGALAAVQRRVRRVRRTRTAVIALPVVAAVGTATAVLPGRGGGDLGPASTVTTPALTPVDGPAPAGTRARFARMSETEYLVNWAGQLLTQQCMKDQGFVFNPNPAFRRADEHTFPTSAGLSVAQAEQYGYEPPPDSPHYDQGEDRLSAAEKTAWQTALSGAADEFVPLVPAPPATVSGGEVDTAGCFGRAMVRAWGGTANLATVPGVLNQSIPEALQAASTDPDHAALAQKWSACMTAAGHPGLRDPDDARSGYAPPTPAPNPSPEAGDQDDALAVPDAQCEQESGYAAGLTALQDRYLAGLAQRYPVEIDHAEQVAEAARARAEQVIQG